MKPTELLEQEHRIIESVLHCLAVLGSCETTGRQIEAPPIRELLEFFHDFADACHEVKEE